MLAIDAQFSMLTAHLFSFKGIYFIRVTDISVHGDTFNLTWPFSKLVLYGCGYYGYFVFVMNHDFWTTRIIVFLHVILFPVMWLKLALYEYSGVINTGGFGNSSATI